LDEIAAAVASERICVHLNNYKRIETVRIITIMRGCVKRNALTTKSIIVTIRIIRNVISVKNKFFTREICACALFGTNSLCAKSSAEMRIIMKENA
jgi:hypothetical protein